MKNTTIRDLGMCVGWNTSKNLCNELPTVARGYLEEERILTSFYFDLVIGADWPKELILYFGLEYETRLNI